MGKKLKLPFLSQSKSLENPKKLEHSTSLPSQWPFPSCGNIKTLSFRADDNAFRTFNSAFLDNEMTASTESFFTTVSSSSRTFSTMSEDLGDPFETVIHGLKSDRLFFEPEQSCSLMSVEKQQEQDRGGRPGTSTLLDQKKVVDTEETEVVYKESEALSLESINPYEDFKRSMMEMVEAHDLKDWQGLEELLGCYLKINGKNNHGYIMGAFIDLLVSLSFDTKTINSTTNTITNTSTSTTTTSSSSTTSSSLLSTNLMNCSSSPCSPLSLPSSSLTTPCLSSLFDHEDHNDNHDINDGDNDEEDDR